MGTRQTADTGEINALLAWAMAGLRDGSVTAEQAQAAASLATQARLMLDRRPKAAARTSGKSDDDSECSPFEGETF